MVTSGADIVGVAGCTCIVPTTLFPLTGSVALIEAVTGAVNAHEYSLG